MSKLVSHAASVLRSKAPPSLGYLAMYAKATASPSPNPLVFTSEGGPLYPWRSMCASRELLKPADLGGIRFHDSGISPRP